MSSSLPDGWRRLREDDAAAAAELLAEDERWFGLGGRISADEVRSWWHRTKLESNSWGREEEGGLVAFGWLERYGEDVVGAGCVRPGAKGRGLGTGLLEIAEQRGRELAGACFRQITLGRDEAARRLLEARGYREVRRHYHMEIDLDSEPPEPGLPDRLEIDTFRDDEGQVFHDAVVDAFSEEWGFHPLPFEEWWDMRKSDDKSLWFVIRDEGVIAAYARCEVAHGGGFVGMLGVRTPWRRRGLGRALLLHAFREFRRRGFERVGLGVDAENPTGATRLYEAVGMHVAAEHVTFEKQLT